MKVLPKKLSQEDYIATLDALYTAAGTMKGRDAVKLFLKNLLTESERVMLGRRILIARRLLEKRTYDEISEEFSAGPATIARIHQWLGVQFSGYEHAVNNMEREFEKRRKKREDAHRYATSAFYRLKKKYPLYFIFFPTKKM